MKINNGDLNVTDRTLQITAKQALDKGIGARALRSLMERILNDVLYDILVVNKSPAAVTIDKEPNTERSQVRATVLHRKDGLQRCIHTTGGNSESYSANSSKDADKAALN